MRADTVFRMDNTFDVYEGVYTQDPVTGEMIGTYTYFTSDKGLVISGAGGEMYLATRQGYPLRAAIRNMRDRNGVALFSIGDTEYDMYVIHATPQYDAMGSVVGWRHRLSRELPRTLAERWNTVRAGL